MLTIQRLQKEDIEQVVYLEKCVFTQPWKKDAIEKMSEDRNAIFLVAKINDEVVGNCALRMILGEGEITNVSVKEDFRRQGIARKMISRLLSEGKKEGIQAFSLEVRVKNLAAISLYESFTFKKEGLRKKFYTDPTDDAWIMWVRN